MENKQQEETMKDRIIGLLGKGYKRAQLIQDFGFAERTVDAAIRAYKELGYGSAEDAEGSRPGANEGAPGSSSKSGGKEAAGGRDGSLAIRKEKESVLPEWLERDVAEIFDGQTRDQRIFLAGMSVPLMGLRLFAEGVKPIIDLLATWQEGQAQAARAVQGSGMEIARAAAQEAVSGMTPQFMQAMREASTASSPNPFASMVTRLFEPYLQQMMSGLMRGFGMPMAGMVGGQGQGQPGEFQQGQPAFTQSGFQQATENEIKEAFENG
jgi:Rod binding domain-containing protein